MANIDYEKEYDNRGRIPEHPQIFARWDRDAAAYRDKAKGNGAQFDISYGNSERQKYDFFPGSNHHAGAALAVFIHGGWWRTLGREKFSHIAAGLNAQGVAVAVPSYDLCPNVGIPQIIEQTRVLCLALWAKYKKRLMVAGHSAGGHLAACMVATDWHSVSREAPADLVPFGYAISGVFELAPLLQVSVNSDLRLDAATAKSASPLHWKLPPQRSLDAVVGADESSEFLRQSKLIAEEWGKRGVVTRYEEAPGNHFTVIEPLADPNSEMTKRAAKLAERVNAMLL